MADNPSATPDPKEIIREEWQGAAPSWKKWCEKLALQSNAATELVVAGAQVQPGMKVLDLASGSGQPALTLAAAVGPTGRVVATDLVPEMLQAAEDNSKARHFTNMEFRAADA